MGLCSFWIPEKLVDGVEVPTGQPCASPAPMLRAAPPTASARTCFSMTQIMESTVTITDFPSGGYRYIPAVFQYSGGVSALPVNTIRRYRFRSPVPLLDGFDRIRNIIGSADRPLTSFCACELRSPALFTEEEFRTFNEKYVVALERWGLFEGYSTRWRAAMFARRSARPRSRHFTHSHSPSRPPTWRRRSSFPGVPRQPKAPLPTPSAPFDVARPRLVP